MQTAKQSRVEFIYDQAIKKSKHKFQWNGHWSLWQLCDTINYIAAESLEGVPWYHLWKDKRKLLQFLDQHTRMPRHANMLWLLQFPAEGRTRIWVTQMPPSENTVLRFQRKPRHPKDNHDDGQDFDVANHGFIRQRVGRLDHWLLCARVLMSHRSKDVWILPSELLVQIVRENHVQLFLPMQGRIWHFRPERHARSCFGLFQRPNTWIS